MATPLGTIFSTDKKAVRNPTWS